MEIEGEQDLLGMLGPHFLGVMQQGRHPVCSFTPRGAWPSSFFQLLFHFHGVVHITVGNLVKKIKNWGRESQSVSTLLK